MALRSFEIAILKWQKKKEKKKEKNENEKFCIVKYEFVDAGTSNDVW